jgi:hypothetical protein
MENEVVAVVDVADVVGVVVVVVVGVVVGVVVVVVVAVRHRDLDDEIHFRYVHESIVLEHSFEKVHRDVASRKYRSPSNRLFTSSRMYLPEVNWQVTKASDRIVHH